MTIRSVPHLHREIIDRPRLGPPTDVSEWPSLMVLRGAGGAGKSTVLAQWANVAAATGASVIWVRVQPEHVGPKALLAEIVAHVDRASLLEPGEREDIESQPITTETLRVFFDTVASRLPVPPVLVLDDYHHVRNAGVDDILASLAGAGVVRLLIGTRTSDRLQAVSTASKMTLLARDGASLGFSEKETLQLMRSRGLVPDMVLARDIHRISGGWPLATHSLIVARERGAWETTLKPLTPSGRSALVMELLRETIVGSHPSVRDFVLRTSLAEDVTFAEAASYTGYEAGPTKAILDVLERDGVGTWSTRDGDERFSYHALVRAEFEARARAELAPDELRKLMDVIIENILTTRPSRALELAVELKQWERAADILSANLDTLSLGHYAATFRTLDTIPRSVREEWPGLGTVHAFMQYGQKDTIVSKVRQGLALATAMWRGRRGASMGFDAVTDPAVAMGGYRLLGDEKRAVELAAVVVERLESLSAEEFDRERVIVPVVLNQVAITHLYVEEYDDAQHHAATSRAFSEERSLRSSQVHSISLSAMAFALSGEMNAAREVVADGDEGDNAFNWRNEYLGTGYRVARAFISLEEERADLAMDELEALAVDDPTTEHWPLLAMTRAITLAQLRGADAGYDLLSQWIARRRRRTPPVARLRAAVEQLRADLLLQQGQPVRAEKHIIRGEEFSPGPSLQRAKLLITRGDSIRASALADEVAWQAMRRPRRRAEALIVKAHALHAADRGEDAGRTLSEAVALMDANGVWLPVLSAPRDELRAIAATTSHLDPDRFDRFRADERVARVVQPLSPAELRALQAILDTGTVETAATLLHLSDSTVRYHLKRTYRKLGVSTRSEALNRAIDLGMLRGH